MKEEMAALSEYFADVDDTPLEEEEPPGTKWVSMVSTSDKQGHSKMLDASKPCSVSSSDSPC